MNIFKRLFKTQPEPEQRAYIPDSIGLLFGSYAFTGGSMQLSTVYRCVDLISNTVAQMDCRILKDNKGHYVPNTEHPAYMVLNKQPNKYMTRFTLMKAVVSSMLLNGNAYIYINRDVNGNAKELLFINSNDVTVQMINSEVIYMIKGYGKVENENLIHIKNFTYDGITGISTISNAKMTLETAFYAEKHANNFFTNGTNLSGVLTANGNLTDKQKSDILESWNKTYNSGGNGIAILSGNMDYKPISIKPAEAQLLETRKYSVTEICRFFGVSPIMAFDMEKNSYNSAEASSLAFLQETIQPILEKIELELWSKLFKPSEKRFLEVRFNTDDYLKLDKKSTASYYSQLFQMGVMTTNEIREKLGLPKVKDGDRVYVQANVVAANKPIEEMVDK
ncbi:MAG: phage portal protein [Sarcina sp.]